jgi:uncharacterized protein YndB with AHSA1/START domain
MSERAARELRAETTIDAPPERVWETLADLRRMPEWSPELVRMVPLKRGGLKVGQQYLGINRRRAVIWPSRSVVAVVDPGRSLAWDTRTSGARWIYELESQGAGTRVVHRRPVPRRIAWISRAFTPLFLGGSDEHADELEQGMGVTLERLKAAVER